MNLAGTRYELDQKMLDVSAVNKHQKTGVIRKHYYNFYLRIIRPYVQVLENIVLAKLGKEQHLWI